MDLVIHGMTCVVRILNKLDAVGATVNYAPEKAAVDYDPAEASLDEVLGAVEAAGYHANDRPPASRRSVSAVSPRQSALWLLSRYPVGSGSARPAATRVAPAHALIEGLLQ